LLPAPGRQSLINHKARQAEREMLAIESTASFQQKRCFVALTRFQRLIFMCRRKFLGISSSKRPTRPRRGSPGPAWESKDKANPSTALLDLGLTGASSNLSRQCGAVGKAEGIHKENLGGGLRQNALGQVCKARTQWMRGTSVRRVRHSSCQEQGQPRRDR
jgi:hypothetical protein